MAAKDSDRNMLVTKLWIKYMINIVVHFVEYLYITDLMNVRKVEHTEMTIDH
jgi:hypothetical protein